MQKNQLILLCIATIFITSFFTPLVTMTAFLPSISMLEQSGGSKLSVSYTLFSIITFNEFSIANAGDDNIFPLLTYIFCTSLIGMAILTVIIALNKKFEWLFAISFPFLIFCFSYIYTLVSKTSESKASMQMLDWGWAGIIIPSLVLLTIGIYFLFKKKEY